MFALFHMWNVMYAECVQYFIFMCIFIFKQPLISICLRKFCQYTVEFQVHRRIEERKTTWSVDQTVLFIPCTFQLLYYIFLDERMFGFDYCFAEFGSHNLFIIFFLIISRKSEPKLRTMERKCFVRYLFCDNSFLSSNCYQVDSASAEIIHKFQFDNSEYQCKNSWLW